VVLALLNIFSGEPEKSIEKLHFAMNRYFKLRNKSCAKVERRRSY